ncbi:MAG: hypothetical protein MAG431_01132 [Chloroflexi bacterium]|nr:hypothetical protein [Chloroflexota bacterium]
MGKTKLTVRVPQDLLDNFRQYAQENKTTMTNLVKAYLRRIPPQDSLADAPITRRLSGTLSKKVSIDDYKEHLSEKYGN